MSTASHLSREASRLQQILAQELAHLTPDRLPGVEGTTTDQMLHEYGHWAQQGIVPGPQQLERQYPELANQLHSFFTSSATD